VDIGTGTRKDAQEDKKIDLKDIIAAKSLEEVYLSIINQKIFKLFYASPSDYFKYIGEGMQIKLDQDLVLNYIEIKATRDLIVHNKGKVNDIYIQKAGIKARAKDTKQNIPITLEYHISSYSILKKIVRETYESVSGHYLKLTKKSQLYSTKA
jgi:hypothetical protein